VNLVFAHFSIFKTVFNWFKSLFEHWHAKLFEFSSGDGSIIIFSLS
jgi:hypothetical protein